MVPILLKTRNSVHRTRIRSLTLHRHMFDLRRGVVIEHSLGIFHCPRMTLPIQPPPKAKLLPLHRYKRNSTPHPELVRIAVLILQIALLPNRPTSTNKIPSHLHTRDGAHLSPRRIHHLIIPLKLTQQTLLHLIPLTIPRPEADQLVVRLLSHKILQNGHPLIILQISWPNLQRTPLPRPLPWIQLLQLFGQHPVKRKQKLRIRTVMLLAVWINIDG